MVDSIYLKPEQVMLVAAHNDGLAAARKCGLGHPPASCCVQASTQPPVQKRDLKAEGQVERRRHIDDRSREEAWVLTAPSSRPKPSEAKAWRKTFSSANSRLLVEKVLLHCALRAPVETTDYYP